MVKYTNVKRHSRKLRSGKKTVVRRHSRKINRASYAPLSEEVVERLSSAHLTKTSPDYMTTSRITFLKGNMLWATTPGKYDVLNYDAPNVPEYEKIPKKALPNQIIQVKGKFYLGNENGRFERTFPPRVNKSRYVMFKEEYLKTHGSVSNKEAIWDAYRKKITSEKQISVKKRDWERMRTQRGIRTYHAKRSELREAKKAEKDLNLRPLPGWHTIQTIDYGVIPGKKKKGGFPFARDGKNYYSWPGKKEREKLIKKGELKI